MPLPRVDGSALLTPVILSWELIDSRVWETSLSLDDERGPRCAFSSLEKASGVPGAVVNGVECLLLSRDVEEIEVRVLAAESAGCSSFWPSKPPIMELRVLLRGNDSDIVGRFRADDLFVPVGPEGGALASINYFGIMQVAKALTECIA